MSTCPNCRGATTAVLGHGDPFPPRWLNVRCVIRHGTFAETNGNGRDAPFPAVRRVAVEPLEGDRCTETEVVQKKEIDRLPPPGCVVSCGIGGGQDRGPY